MHVPYILLCKSMCFRRYIWHMCMPSRACAQDFLQVVLRVGGSWVPVHRKPLLVIRRPCQLHCRYISKQKLSNDRSNGCLGAVDGVDLYLRKV